MSENAPREMLLDYDRLIKCNLIPEHRHKDAQKQHTYHHLRIPPHERDNDQCNGRIVKAV